MHRRLSRLSTQHIDIAEDEAHLAQSQAVHGFGTACDTCIPFAAGADTIHAAAAAHHSACPVYSPVVSIKRLDTTDAEC
jgi:hypothetical protein